MRLRPSSILHMLPCFLILASGCRSTLGPKMPPVMSAPAITEYKADDFKMEVTRCRCLVSGTCKDSTGGAIPVDLAAAQVLRNQIAYRVMADIESSYSKFEMSLTTQRAGFESGADTVQLGMSAAASLVGAADVKDILTASLTGFQGARLSLDKNFFREKTTESIISQMRASRKAKQAELIKSLATRPVTDYPWDAVWIDLVDFYYAGTVPSALVEIASTSGKKAEEATQNLSDTVELLSTTPDQEKMSRANRIAYEQLQKAAKDPATADKAKQTLQKTLAAAGYPATTDATIDDLLAQFRAAIHDTTTSNMKLLRLYKAVTANSE
jgi:hypothetical protein